MRSRYNDNGIMMLMPKVGEDEDDDDENDDDELDEGELKMITMIAMT